MTGEDEPDPDRVPLSPEARKRINDQMRALLAPANDQLRASVNAMLAPANDQLRESINAMLAPANDQLRASVNAMLAPANDQLRASVNAMLAPANDQLRKTIAEMFDSPAVKSKTLEVVLPQMEELNRSVVAALSGSGTLSAAVEVVASGSVSDRGLMPSAGEVSTDAVGRTPQIGSAEAVLVFMALYSFLKDFSEDSLAENAQNSLWSLALLLVVLMLNAKPNERD